MFMLRGLGAMGRALAGFGDLCPPPAGYTWNGTNWERLRVGATPQPGPCGATVTVVDHTAAGPFIDPARPAQNPLDASSLLQTWPQIFQNLRDFQANDPEKANAAALIATGTVPPCPSSSFVDSTDCYGTIGNASGIALQAVDGPATSLSIPGTFSLWGVRFNIGDVVNGGYSKSFIPTPQQQLAIDSAIVSASQDDYVRSGNSNPLNLYSSKVSNTASVRQALSVPIASFCGDTQAMAEARSATGTFQTCVTPTGPSAAWWLPNFSLNPINPTNGEFDGIGGYKTWRARGGYLINLGYVDGTLPLLSQAGIGYCQSILCNCNGRLSCIVASVGKNQPGPNERGTTWNIYVKIDQGPPWQYTIILRPVEPDWLDDVASYLADTMTAIGRLFCGQQTQKIVNDQINATAAEKCVDKSGNICKKGVPIGGGCACTSPPDTQKVEVQAAKTTFGFACKEWLDGNPVPPVWEAPTPLNPPTFPTGPVSPPFSIPLWAIALVGLGAGAFVFSRK